MFRCIRCKLLLEQKQKTHISTTTAIPAFSKTEAIINIMTDELINMFMTKPISMLTGLTSTLIRQTASNYFDLAWRHGQYVPFTDSEPKVEHSVLRQTSRESQISLLNNTRN